MTQTNQKQQTLNGEQIALVAELAETYGIEPEEISFFSADAKPFFSYEATCALVNQLTGVQDITIEPMEAVMPDSVSLRCSLLTEAGHTRSAVGVANVNETIDGLQMSDQQIYSLAGSRAIRNALRTAGIDLMKLHLNAKNGGNDLDFKVKTNVAALIGQAHQLGKAACLIIGDDKTTWYALLKNRYNVSKSNELDETQLADFVAVLRTLVPQFAG